RHPVRQIKPLNRPDCPLPLFHSLPHTASGVARKAFSEVTVMPARILVCEDSPIEQAALSLFLRQQGYEVSTAADGAQTIDHIKSNPVDAVLLDLKIPKTDGFGVLN